MVNPRPKKNKGKHRHILVDTFQLRVTQQDGSPLQGQRSDVTVSVRCTWEEETLTTPDYYYVPPSHSYQLPELQMAVPDTSIVAIQVPIPSNSTEIYVQVGIYIFRT